MLPISVIANWCEANTSPYNFYSTLREYIFKEHKEYETRDCPAGSMAVSWKERTRLTFGGSDWYSIDGSLLLDARRAILFKPAPDNPRVTHVVLVALLPTSLVHLKNMVASLVEGHLEASLSPLELPLGGIAREFYGREQDTISGVSVAGWGGERRVAFQPPQKIFGQHEELFRDDAGGRREDSAEESIEELYLHFGEPDTEVMLSRDGTLTFSNPKVTLDEIDEVLSRIAGANRRRNEARDYETDSDTFFHSL